MHLHKSMLLFISNHCALVYKCSHLYECVVSHVENVWLIRHTGETEAEEIRICLSLTSSKNPNVYLYWQAALVSVFY